MFQSSKYFKLAPSKSTPLNRLWPDIDLGPFKESPPHIRPRLDGQANLTDLTSFAKMWQWRYFNLSFDSVDNAYRTHGALSLEGRGSNITFSIPENTSMAEIKNQ